MLVKVYTLAYLPEDVYDGDIDADSTEESYFVDDVDEAVKIISGFGLSFEASGSDWAADPDGSYTSNYGTGEEISRSAHLMYFTAAQERAIIARVG
jgi:hypothetical protein